MPTEPTWSALIDWDASGRFSGYAREVLADNPVGYWRLGESSGTVAVDLGSGGNNGAYVNTPTLGVAGALTGDSDTAVTFTPADAEEVQIANAAVAGITTQFAVEAWIKPASVASYQVIAADVDVAYTEGWELSNSAGVLRVTVRNPLTTIIAGGLAVGQWYHCVTTYDGSNVRLYLNGTPVGGPVARTASAASTQILRIANRASSGLFSGTIDEVAVYNTALSAARILAHYNAGIANPFDVAPDLQAVEYGAGRARVSDEFAAGTCTLTLENPDGEYSRYDSSSPIYGLMLPGRELKLTASHLGTTYPAFRGTLVDVSEGADTIEGIPTVQLHFVDAFERLRLGLTRTALLQNQRVDQIITAILDDISWPAARRTLDTAIQTVTVFTNHNRVPLNALQLAAKQELNSLLFIGQDGNVVFQGRHYRSAQPLYATVTEMRALPLAFRQEDLIDSVRAAYARYTVEAAASAVWTLTMPRWLPPGTSTFEFELNASGVLGAQSYVTPLVATTDFTCNSQLDGSGTDKTAQVSLSVTASDSGGGTITAVNLDSAQVALRVCQVRALAMLAGGETNVATAAVASPLVTEQTLNKTFEFNDDSSAVQGWAKWQAAVMGADQPRPVITVEGHTDAEIATLLGAGISKKVAVQNTTGLYPTQLNGTFFIEAYRVRARPFQNVEADWTLFSADQAMGTMFRISGAAGAGQDYSTLAAAAATSGDRIGF